MVSALNKKLPLSGFTLIELLIAISIAALLASITLVASRNPQKQARDAERRSELKQYQTALEAFANINSGFYPSYTGDNEATTVCNKMGTTFMPSCPKDPQDPTVKYNYQSNGSGSGTTDATRYVLWATLENPASTYWVLCSTGEVGKGTSKPSGGSCPSGLSP